MILSARRHYPKGLQICAAASALASLPLAPVRDSTLSQVVQPRAVEVNPESALDPKREEARQELEQLSRTISLSVERAEAIAQNIAELEKTPTNLRQALIDSATRRKELEQKINDTQETLARLRLREDEIRGS